MTKENTHTTESEAPFTDAQISDGEKMLAILILKSAQHPLTEQELNDAFPKVLATVNNCLDKFTEITNLKSLVIREGENGGWHPTLLLKSAPPGCAKAIGTPTEQPLKSHDDAFNEAYLMIRQLQIRETLRAEMTHLGLKRPAQSGLLPQFRYMA